jgi:hypothetical protein
MFFALAALAFYGCFERLVGGCEFPVSSTLPEAETGMGESRRFTALPSFACDRTDN